LAFKNVPKRLITNKKSFSFTRTSRELFCGYRENANLPGIPEKPSSVAVQAPERKFGAPCCSKTARYRAKTSLAAGFI
jgi:hypothetical protein